MVEMQWADAGESAMQTGRCGHVFIVVATGSKMEKHFRAGNTLWCLGHSSESLGCWLKRHLRKCEALCLMAQVYWEKHLSM